MKKVVHAACPHDCPDACGVLITVENEPGHAHPGRPGPSRHSRISVRQGGEVSGPRVLAGPGALSHAAGAAEGSGRKRRLVADGRARPNNRCRSTMPAISSESPGTRRWTTLPRDFGQIASEFGSEAILPYSYGGTLGALNGASMDRRFFHRLGASQLARNICSAAGEAGLKSVIGIKLGTEPEQFRTRATSSPGARTFTATTSTCGRSSWKRAATAPSWSSLIRTAPARRRARTGTCPSIPAPTRRWRWA